MVVGHILYLQYLAVCGVGVKAALHQSVHIPGLFVCVCVCVCVWVGGGECMCVCVCGLAYSCV